MRAPVGLHHENETSFAPPPSCFHISSLAPPHSTHPRILWLAAAMGSRRHMLRLSIDDSDNHHFFQNSSFLPPRNADSSTGEAGSQAQQPMRSANMNTFTQPARQAPRLQNTQKTGLGNGNAGAGWAFGAPSSSGAFGGLGGAPPFGQGRPGQLSGFAQVMGGGGGQGPIDMR